MFDRREQAGGKAIEPKTLIPAGLIAMIIAKATKSAYMLDSKRPHSEMKKVKSIDILLDFFVFGTNFTDWMIITVLDLQKASKKAQNLA